MIRREPRWVVVSSVVLAAVFCLMTSVTAAQPYQAPQQFPWEDLSHLGRGHRLHILYGLQLSGWCGPEGVGEHNGVWNASRWAESNLTTPTWNKGYAPDFLGAPPGDKNWGHWGGGKVFDAANYPDEQAYLDTLTLLQYSDESALNDPATFADNVTALAAYRQQYPNAISFIDEHGSQVLQYGATALRDFIAQGRPDMVVMNDYLFDGTTTYVKGGTPYAVWTSMAALRAACLAGYTGDGTEPIPAGQFLQTSTTYPNLHVMTESELNVYIFSSLAFGFKTLIAYRYGDSTNTDIEPILFTDAGYANPTPLFYSYADANAQARNLGPALVRLLSTDISVVRGYYNSGGVKSLIPLNPQTPVWSDSDDPYMKSITAENLGTENSGYEGSVLVGYFKPLDESLDGPGYSNQEYFMLVNALTSATAGEDATQQRITVTFDFADSGITQLLRVNRTTGALETVPLQHLSGSQYSLEVTLGGGIGDLFKYDTGAPFVGMNGPWTDGDHDGLSDAFESNNHVYLGQYSTGTSPNNADSDHDGLTDGDEVFVYGTNPVAYDTDGDFLGDGYEIQIGNDPNNPNDGPEVPALSPIAMGGLPLLLAVGAVLWMLRRPSAV